MTAAKDAMGAYEFWAASQSRFTEKTKAFYRLLWEGWLAALPPGLDWKEATKVHVLKFLDSAAPGQSRPAKDPARMAAATRYRYYRVLQGVYKSAVAAELLPASRDPTLLDGDKLSPGPETRIGQVLPPTTLATLRDPQLLPELVPPTAREDWQPLRDRALVALLAHCGPSVSELAALRGEHLLQGGQALRPLRQGAIADVEPVPLWLQIPGDAQRSLLVPAAIVPLLQQWLLARDGLLERHSLRMVRQPDRQGIPAVAEAPLFPSRQVPSAGAALPPLDERIIYRAVRRYVQAALARGGHEKQIRAGALKVALGPQIVRNSVIADWLASGLDASSVAALAGVKGSASLRVGPVPASKPGAPGERPAAGGAPAERIAQKKSPGC